MEEHSETPKQPRPLSDVFEPLTNDDLEDTPLLITPTLQQHQIEPTITSNDNKPRLPSLLRSSSPRYLNANSSSATGQIETMDANKHKRMVSFSNEEAFARLKPVKLAKNDDDNVHRPLINDYGALNNADRHLSDDNDNNKSGKFYLNHDWTLEKQLPIQQELKKCREEQDEEKRQLRRERLATARSFIIGSFLSVLYNVVFCIAMGSSIRRPHYENASQLVPLAKMSALGVIISTPLLVNRLSIPSLYPGVDLFLAPFLAKMAVIVDDVLYKKKLESGSADPDDELFLDTFVTLAAIGMILSSLVCFLAARFKLANLGAFLPYPALCGFFSSVGVLEWRLAFEIDKGEINFLNSLIHHLPSVIGGIGMKIFFERSPFIIPLFFMIIVTCFYGVMFVCGISHEEAQAANWFWSKEDLKFASGNGVRSFVQGAPSLFGPVTSLIVNDVNFEAVWKGLPTAFAMSLIYLLRNFLHSAAMRKHYSRLVKQSTSDNAVKKGNSHNRMRSVSDFDNEDWALLMESDDESSVVEASFVETVVDERKEPPQSLFILLQYSLNHLCVALAGGFTALPCISVSNNLFQVGAGGKLPQYGSMFLLFVFYWTNFHVTAYIPKAALSSLMVNASLDVLSFWFIQSFSKIESKWEWAVVPLIVVLSFTLGMLQSVAFGIGCSTFLFVASLYRSGVVKFSANGTTIRSTIERCFESKQWLDDNGELIQLLVLKNYLFFGNASAVLPHVQPIFQKASFDEVYLSSSPAHLILDFSLVTGMDTSATEVFLEIIAFCSTNKCRLSFSGVSKSVRKVLSVGGVKKVESKVSFFANLEAALGNAEDIVLAQLSNIEQKERNRTRRRMRFLSDGSRKDDGFMYALKQIDEQHSVDAAVELLDLKPFISSFMISPGQRLFISPDCPGDGIVKESERGLFFIEHGVLKVEQDPNYKHNTNSYKKATLGPLRRRSVDPKADDIDELLKDHAIQSPSTTQTLRLARIGPGWVVGAIEGFTGMKNPGIHTAVTSCRLHHLPYSSLRKIEQERPALALKLSKLLAHLTSRRQELTIQHLNRFHSIMQSSD